ncbi:ROK family protein [Actinoplanes sp. N902-109]|uniref:ROK family protein n=1 Tax=Actinoplanes sp. (strain N902-109) TaxID=649831 RepID=UPI0003295A6E|nr:ROK family protein [Actinoplanes sp. N902-109]AGL19211.1 kanosamine kinase [Actinoplanes sp. N902-109]
MGVDIGGTKVAIRAEDGDRCGYESAFPWVPGHDAGQDLALLAERVAEVGLPLRAAGVALPATVDAAGRVSAWPSRPSWIGLPAGEVFGAIFGAVPVAWADDGDLGALAEARAAGVSDLLYLGVGTGVGGGFVLGGALCPGPGRGSFEIGHLSVGARAGCRCGRTGCLQAVASGPAILDRAARARRMPVTYQELCRAAGTAPWAITALGTAYRALATAIVSVAELLHPRLVVVGGGFLAGVPGATAALNDQVAGLRRPGQEPLPVRAAALGGLSSLAGAVELARSL